MSFFSIDHFMPHGHCYLWRPDILWLNVLSDAVIALSYFAIPFALVYFARKRKDLSFNWIFFMFAIFILACGTTHLIEIIAVWKPIYGIQGLVKFFTATVSLATAVVLFPLVPKALKLPSFDELEMKNRELKNLYENLQLASQSRLKRVIEAAPHGLVMVDMKGKIVLCNARIESLFGYNRSEILGQRIERLVPEGKRNLHPDLVRKYLENPETTYIGANRDLTGMRKDGTEFPVEIGLNPVDTGDDLFVLASIVDITERKNIEKELNHAISARDEFLSIASHELKTPLTSLSLQLQIAEKKARSGAKMNLTDEGWNKVFETTNKQIHRITNLVEDLLDASRINSGQFTYNFEEVDLSLLVRDMVARFETSSKFQVTTEIESGIHGTFDPLRIEQVIDNLLSNAEKYAHGKPVKVSLKRNSNKIILVIEDQGPGIAPERQKRIFDRFERASTSHHVTGLGLGLFIVKEIVGAHSGNIRLESELGRGARFILEFPVT